MPIISGGGSSSSSGSLIRISTTTLAAPAASIALSSIPGTYSSLLLVCSIRSAVTAEVSALCPIRFNADSAANYYYQHSWTQNATTSGASSTAQTSLAVLLETGPSADANDFGRSSLLIPDYASTTRLKTCVTPVGIYPAVAAATNYFTGVSGGMWNSTAAITAITIFASDLTSNLAAGSNVQLYGLQ